MGFPDFNILTTAHPTHFMAVKDESAQSLAVTAYQGIPQMSDFQEMPTYRRMANLGTPPTWVTGVSNAGWMRWYDFHTPKQFSRYMGNYSVNANNSLESIINSILVAQLAPPSNFSNGSWTCSLMFAANAAENPMQGTALDTIAEISTVKNSLGLLTIHEIAPSSRPRIWRAYFPLSHYASMVMNITQNPPWFPNWYLMNPDAYSPPSTTTTTAQGTIFSNIPSTTTISNQRLAINHKTVTLTATFSTTANISDTSSPTLATVASGYRPAVSMNGIFVGHSPSYVAGQISFNISSAGAITPTYRPSGSAGAVPINTPITLCVTYVIL